MTFDEWYKNAKIFPPGTRAQMKMAYEAGHSDVQHGESSALLRELYEFPYAPDRGGCDWKCNPCDCGYAEWEPGYRALQKRIDRFLNPRPDEVHGEGEEKP